MLCPGVLSGGGKEVVVTEARVGLLVGFFMQVGMKLEKCSLCCCFIQERSLTCVSFLLLSCQ